MRSDSMRKGRAAWPLGLAATVAGFAAWAQPAAAPRWTSGFNQGVAEAMVRAPDGSSVSFACPTARADAAPSVAVQRQGRPPAGRATLRVIVDGRTHELALVDGFVEGRAGPADVAIRDTATALTRSRSPSFTAEIADLGWRQEFALDGAREALGGPGGRTIVDGCLR